MKNTLPFLEERFQSPGEWQESLRRWLKANGQEVTQEKVLMDMILFHELKFDAAAKVYTFFQGSVDPSANSVTNVTGNMSRNTGEHFIIVGMRLMTGVNATLSATAWTFGVADADVRNGNVNFLNNTTQVLRNIPGTAFNPNLTTEDQGIHWLSEPLLWAGQTPISVPLVLQNVIATVNTNVRMELIGFGLNA